MTEITLTRTQWNDIHDEFKAEPGDGQLALAWDEDTNALELVRVALSPTNHRDLALATA